MGDLMELMIKLVLMGDGAVGKTSLVERFIHNSFAGKYRATMGLDISLKTLIF